MVTVLPAYAVALATSLPGLPRASGKGGRACSGARVGGPLGAWAAAPPGAGAKAGASATSATGCGSAAPRMLSYSTDGAGCQRLCANTGQRTPQQCCAAA